MVSTRPSHAGESKTARDSAVVAGWTLASRVTGLSRIVVIGAVLGPTYFANTFITTNLLPNLTYSVIAGQALALVVVPALVRAIARNGVARAQRLLAHVGGFLLIASGAIAALVVLASPLLVWSLTFGIPNPDVRAQAQHLTLVLILLVVPQIVLYTVAALGAAAQQARERFALAAAAPAVENLLLTGTVAVVGAVWGTGREVGALPVGLLLTLGAGSTLAVAVHAGLQAFGAARVGLPIRASMRWRSDPDAVTVARLIRESVSVPTAPTVAMYTLLVIAATVPGGVVVVETAYAVFLFPIALGARAVSTAVLPGMSAAVERGDHAGFSAAWRQALTYVAITSLPPLLLLGLLAHPVAEVLANGELRSGPQIDQLAACLTVVAVAQLAAGVHTIGRQALFARIDIAGPRQASLALLVVTLGIAVGSLLAPAGTVRLVVLCVALLAGELVGAITVLAKLRSMIRPERLADRVRMTKVVVATAAMLPAIAAGSWLLEANDAGRLADLAVLAGCGPIALTTFAVVLRSAASTQIGRRS